MAEVFLFDKVMSPSELYRQCRLTPKQLYCGADFDGLVSFKPYPLGQKSSQEARTIASVLNVSKNPPNLFKLASEFGPDDTVAVAELMSKLKDLNIVLMGAATSTYSVRMMAFGESIKQYQNALLAYRKTIEVSGASAAVRATAKEVAHLAFEKMQQNFQQELSALRRNRSSGKGSPLRSATRGINIAHSSRNAIKLNISSSTQASNLVRFSHYGKALGNGLIVIDVFTRAGNIHTRAQSGEDWYRQMFIESLSMGTSLYVGKVAVEAGIYFLTVATPVGWVGLILAGAAIAGTAAAASMGTDHIAKQRGGNLYDNVMKWLSDD